jgi:hypothetical protein
MRRRRGGVQQTQAKVIRKRWEDSRESLQLGGDPILALGEYCSSQILCVETFCEALCIIDFFRTDEFRKEMSDQITRTDTPTIHNVTERQKDASSKGDRDVNSLFQNPHIILVGMSLGPPEFVSEVADHVTF